VCEVGSRVGIDSRRLRHGCGGVEGRSGWQSDAKQTCGRCGWVLDEVI
jgi:hypothetical protein